MIVPIEVSARHIHLTHEILEKLFGLGAVLHPRKELSQPGTFAAEETATIKTPKAEIAHVRILGPLRDYNQIEISKTDARTLGIDPPIRDSHELDHAGTPGITLIGPKGVVELDRGVIVAWRHIHINPAEATENNLTDGQLVSINIDSDPRSVIFENVLIRVSPKAQLAMHIDTDEANATGTETGESGTVILPVSTGQKGD